MASLERSLRFETLRGVHVLVVDDRRIVRDTLRDMLEQCGAKAWVAGSAEAAATILGIFRPAVVLTDLVMPDHDGYWLLREVRAHMHEVPVIAMTGLPQDHPEDKVLAAGFDAYMAKPFNSTY